eukprot:850035-Pleurochrysis_carterae.AAC.4
MEGRCEIDYVQRNAVGERACARWMPHIRSHAVAGMLLCISPKQASRIGCTLTPCNATRLLAVLSSRLYSRPHLVLKNRYTLGR